jgi:hypothetical protein
MGTITRGRLARAWLAVAFAAGAALLLSGGAVAAESDESLLTERFQFGFGTFINGSKLKIRLDGEAGLIGTPVDWSKTIGDKDLTRFRVDGLWRITNRHHVRLMYTDYNWSTVRSIDEEIIWDGEVIPVGASVRAFFGFEVAEVSYEYAFVKRPDLEVAGTVGLHFTSMEASLVGRLQIGDGQGTVESGGDTDFDAPLPVFGVRGLWRWRDDLYFDLLAQAFSLSVDEYDGRILNLRGFLIWQWTPQLGLGIGYDWFDVDIDGEEDDFRGTLDWTYEGPQIFLNFAF